VTGGGVALANRRRPCELQFLKGHSALLGRPRASAVTLLTPIALLILVQRHHPERDAQTLVRRPPLPLLPQASTLRLPPAPVDPRSSYQEAGEVPPSSTNVGEDATGQALPGGE